MERERVWSGGGGEGLRGDGGGRGGGLTEEGLPMMNGGRVSERANDNKQGYSVSDERKEREHSTSRKSVLYTVTLLYC